MRSPAGRVVNVLRNVSSSACTTKRGQSSSAVLPRGPVTARSGSDSAHKADAQASDTFVFSTGDPLPFKSSPSSKSTPRNTLSRPREVSFTKNPGRHYFDSFGKQATASEQPGLPPVKLKSTTWMETVDAETEKIDDWDGPLAFEESESDLDANEPIIEASSGDIVPEQSSSPNATNDRPSDNSSRLERDFPGLCTITLKEDCISVALPGKSSRRLSYSQLRELCRCPMCLHPSTRQRTRTLGELRADLKKEGWLNGDVDALSRRIVKRGAFLEIKWDQTTHRQHLSNVLQNMLPLGVCDRILTRREERVGWPDVPSLYEHLKQGPNETAAGPGTRSAKIDYKHLFQNNSVNVGALRRVLTQAHRYGFSIIGGVPTKPTGDRNCSLRQVAEAIGPLRNTFYGETWDVKNMYDSKNVAYTDLNLGLHMDLLYHTEPPRYQLLHCLRNRVQGGESYFVDGFAAAYDFERDHPEKAALLQQIPLAYEYHNDGHHMENTHVILPRSLTRLRSAIAWSPPFQGTRRVKNGPMDESFLDAVALWESYLAQDARRLEFKMEEGDLVFFDNRRVLHARRAFRNWTEQEKQQMGLKQVVDGQPQRWLKGCYLDGDTVWDKLVQLSIDHSKSVGRERKTQAASAT